MMYNLNFIVEGKYVEREMISWHFWITANRRMNNRFTLSSARL